MPIKILMPALSPTMTEGTLAKWHKKEGDQVRSGDLLAEIETDKATMEVEAADDGVLGKIIVPDGTHHVAVNELIAVLLEEGETLESMDLNVLSPKKEETSLAKPPVPERLEIKQENSLSSPTRILASPLAKRLAAQQNIPLATLQGSGPQGRIIKRDVEAANVHAISDTGPAFEDRPLTPMRSVIATRLTESKQTVPHFYLTVDCDMTAVFEARKNMNAALEPQRKKLTVNDFVVWACAQALKEVPAANVVWMGDHIRSYRHVDIAIAVAIDGGLVTPVIRQAHKKSFITLSDEVKALIKKAQAKKLMLEEMLGGAMSISNLGMYGVQQFNAIINPPQSSILAVGAAEERPCVHNETIVIRPLMTCTLSVDHRVIDGAVAAHLLGSIKKHLENPWIMLVKG